MNLSAIQTFGERAAQLGEELWPATVTIAGSDYPAEVPDPRENFIVANGREEAEGELVIRIRKSQLATEPAPNQPVAVSSGVSTTTWWIESVRSDSLGARWVLRCTPKN